MRKYLRTAAALAGALASVVVAAPAAQAETGAGAPNSGCTNAVSVQRTAGRVYAYGSVSCTGVHGSLAPEVNLSGNGGSVNAQGQCGNTSYCRTPLVTLLEAPGAGYGAANGGSVDGQWTPSSSFARASLTGQAVPWEAGDYPVAGNWDYGPDGVGVWRSGTGQFLLRADGGGLMPVSWGQWGDVPVSGNWDGSGPDNVGVWRPSAGEFQLRGDTGGNIRIPWGQWGDVPVSGNWDYGPDNVGVYRPSAGEFHLRLDDGTLHRIAWGDIGDIPVSGNWDGSGPDNVGVWRPDTGQFLLRGDGGNLITLPWGQRGDVPVSGNWDGGAAENVGIWRPSTAEFHLRMDNGSLRTISWGNPR
ncbi:hypothetical protein ACIRBX_11540 [Kitasatospora sp. NPDC096147]|uniref:hypothetical protein n=1 Tax=Kitasatospora sp. NPDC096147 TaxID=3364093 RepID=UPI00381F3F87